ncbi:hypothetical protein CesoFtcFv8_019422 [Champsocephalus esox]|uniref:Uncharacterized protein n=1 Tax=Champsocephalus esox TaxID=159716 RepID=A0AAN8BE45_9TELE|nr:hypothetical protein CesoFtcFv8_019422 [Champsocephalus esox]
MEPVSSACTSATDALAFGFLKEWNGSKEVVKKHLVLCLLYVVTEAYYYICSHSQLTDLTTHSRTLIDFQTCNVSRGSCAHPHFYTPGFGFFGDVLLDRQTALEGNHLLINRLRFFRIDCCTECFPECFYHWSDSEELISMPWGL